MNQFKYRPPSAGRSLLRNSEEKNDHEDLKKEKEEIEEHSLKSVKAYIFEIIQEYLK